ncbi:REP-associated tyrosine transposase [Pseudomonas oryzihabitans]|uniref:Transposase n=1 Tax=Pseudomonas oryzihabitans TaxID=47885 RepID=A0A178LI53_9PSED|nr:transposase [Pseudomonas oryzihabitans]MXS20883.1 transposase [Pseudomonas oryzihabitans]OAN30427.1 transposase [Pseudomonas oryzihabitans]
MLDYRRSRAAGGIFFFTLNLNDHSATLLVDHIGSLRQAVREVKVRHPFDILAMVVLPDHLHALWRLPDDDGDYPLRWSLIKAGFSRQLPPLETVNLSRRLKRERGIWQRRYWEHRIRDEQDLQRHFDYIHFNPVKHGHARRAVEWPYSSIHRYVRAGVLPADWAGQRDEDWAVGER